MISLSFKIFLNQNFVVSSLDPNISVGKIPTLWALSDKGELIQSLMSVLVYTHTGTTLVSFKQNFHASHERKLNTN